MKRIFLSIASAVMILMASGCHEQLDTMISELQDDITLLEEKVSTLNSNVSALSGLVSALEQNDHISSITSYSADGRTGHRITFSSGNSILILDGTNGVMPILGVRFNEERGDYYWTIQMGEDSSPTWMTNSYGLRVRATASAPKLKIEDGIWWVSYDGTNYEPYRALGVAQGSAGQSVFQSIDTSDPYMVVFTLANGEVLHLPTKKAFDELQETCDAINSEFETYTRLVGEADKSIFITSVTAFQNPGGDSGYTIHLENGNSLTIRTGRSNRDSVLVSARTYTDGELYWAYRTRSSEDYKWITYSGKMIPVTLKDVTPVIGLTQKDGSIYFTVSYNGGEPQLMTDGDGKPVAATGTIVSDFFTDADLSDPNKVTLTLSDGSTVVLTRKHYHTPKITLHARNSGVKCDTTYTYQLIVEVSDTLSTKDVVYSTYEDYCNATGVSLKAIAVDGGYTHEPRVITVSSKMLDNGVFYSFNVDIPFTTAPKNSWVVGRKARYAIFLTWDDNTIMQVAEFECL